MRKKNIKKSVTTYLSKLKKLPSHVHLSMSDHPAASRLLSSCQYPNASPFHAANSTCHRISHSAKLSDIEAYMQEHFKSLYINDSQEPLSNPNHPPADHVHSTDHFYISPADHVHSTDHFYISPGTSSSLAEMNTSASASCSSESREKVPCGGVALTTYSRAPYEEFRRSMQEMVDAHPEKIRQELDWDFLEGLLNWYLKSNERSVHKHILRAFVDLTQTFCQQELTAEGQNPAVGKSVRRRRAKIE